MEKENAVDKFFAELPNEDKKEADIFNEKPQEKLEEKKEDSVPVKDDEPRKNRRHRRLEQQLEEEREARIKAEAKLEGMSESDKFSRDTTSLDEDTKELLTMYGDDPNGRRAAEIHKKLLEKAERRAEERAIDTFEKRQQESQQQQKQFEVFIDTELENIEDEFNIDVTSDSPQARKTRREFLELVQKLSPKDENGTITNYADFGGAWELYQNSLQSNTTNSRQKEIAARSMTKSGSSSSQTKQPTAGFDGWKTDLGIE